MEKFGRLTIIKKTNKKTKDNRFLYQCMCECGTIVEKPRNVLVTGNTTSCGCFRKENSAKTVLKVQHLAAKAASITNKKHGLKGTRFYTIWIDMKQRCKDLNNQYYGGKGINVSTNWINFINFKNDMYTSYEAHCKEFGEAETTIDRLDSNGHYEVNNCRWATLSEQARDVVINRNSLGRIISTCSYKLAQK